MENFEIVYVKPKAIRQNPTSFFKFKRHNKDLSWILQYSQYNDLISASKNFYYTLFACIYFIQKMIKF